MPGRKSIVALLRAVTPIITAAIWIESASAQAWNNIAGGAFNVATNWTPNSVPSLTTHTASFGLASIYTVTIPSSINIGTLTQTAGIVTLDATGQTVTLASNLRPNGGTMSLQGGTFSGPVSIQNFGALNLLSGATITTSSLVVANASTGQMIVDGGILSSSATSIIGQGGATGTLTFTNGAIGTFGNTVTISSASASSQGNVFITGGAQVTQTNSQLNIGSGGSAGQLGTLSISGAGSRYSHTGGGTITVGSSGVNGAGTLLVSDGTFSSSTGTFNVNPNGTVLHSGGSFLANGNVNITDGIFNQTGGNFVFAPGKIMQISTSGAATFTSDLAFNTLGRLIVSSNATVFATGNVDVATATGSGTLSVNTASLTATSVGTHNWGSNASGTAFVDVIGGTANFSGIISAAAAGTANINIAGVLTANNFTLSSGGIATLTLNTAGSNVNVVDTLSIGTGATGGATVNLSAGSLSSANFSVGSLGRITQTGGVINVGSSIQVNGSYIQTAGSLLVNTGVGVSSNGGTITLNESLALSSAVVSLVNNASFTAAGVALQSGVGTIASGSDVLISTLYLDIGGSGSATFDATGLGTTVNAPGATSYWGSGTGNAATVRFSDQSAGAFNSVQVGRLNGSGTVLVDSGANLTLSLASVIGFGGNGTVLLNGGTLSATQLNLGTLSSGLAGAGVVNIGSGGFLNAGTLLLGDTGASVGTINVGDGATVVSGATQLNTGAVNINGGTASLGVLTSTSTASQVQFNSGTLITTGSLALSPGQPLGATQTIDSSKVFVQTGTLTIHPTAALNITGGRADISTLSLAGGTLNLQSGTLNFTNPAGTSFTGASSALGSALIVRDGATLNTTSTGTIGSSSTVLVESGAKLTATGTLNNSGEIVLEGPAAFVSAGTFNNAGLLRGEGRVNGTFINAASGLIRADLGKTTVLQNLSSNAGTVTLNGGVLQSESAVTNNGRINGRGTFIAPSVTNNATISYSGGITDHFGSLTNNSGSKVIITGGALATFYDNVIASAGSEFRVSSGTAVFLGTVTGTTNFTGSGVKIFENTASPGPLLTSGSTVVELGGSLTVPSIRETSLTLYGPTVIQPDGTTAGTSKLGSLSIVGGSLDLNDNDLIIDYDVSSPIVTVRADLASGVLFSSIANASTSPRFALGYRENDYGLLNFSGQSVDTTSLIIAYTLSGDGNLDGRVNTVDFNNFAGSFGLSGKFWINGDSNYDSLVDSVDFTLLAGNYGQNVGPLGSAALGAVVPEPVGLGMFAMTGLGLRRRRTV